MPKTNKKGLNGMGRFLKAVYLKLFRMNDTPQKIAVGFGLGVFVGVMPFAGPALALIFSIIFRVNRAAALLGSILTNTWLSFLIFLFAAKAGSLVTGTRYSDIRNAWLTFLKDFHWADLLRLSAYDIILPVIIGYAMISLCIGICAYIIAFLAVKYFKMKKTRVNNDIF